jgi:hypothetical protein
MEAGQGGGVGVQGLHINRARVRQRGLRAEDVELGVSAGLVAGA